MTCQTAVHRGTGDVELRDVKKHTRANGKPQLTPKETVNVCTVVPKRGLGVGRTWIANGSNGDNNSNNNNNNTTRSCAPKSTKPKSLSDVWYYYNGTRTSRKFANAFPNKEKEKKNTITRHKSEYDVVLGKRILSITNSAKTNPIQVRSLNTLNQNQQDVIFN